MSPRWCERCESNAVARLAATKHKSRLGGEQWLCSDCVARVRSREGLHPTAVEVAADERDMTAARAEVAESLLEMERDLRD